MPRYIYKCDTVDCGGEEILICKVAEKPDLVKCNRCGAVMDQDFSGMPSAIFKGAGWTPTFSPQGRQTKKG